MTVDESKTESTEGGRRAQKTQETQEPRGGAFHGASMRGMSDVRVFALSAVYSAVFLFFLSPDSYLYDLYYHSDSAVFFVCGKAWMSGMVPYVDFTDSKGPLLWLIYGVGYLLSRHSYVGVYYVSILFYAVTLFAAYKLCLLFACRRAAALATVLLPGALLCFVCHFEVRAEDFCYPFETVALYCLCRCTVRRDGARAAGLDGAVTGACCACCVMIKYNIGAAVAVIAAAQLWLSWRRGTGRRCLAGMCGGIAAVLLPFAVCFGIYGNTGAFVREYFLNTFLTMRTDGMMLHTGSVARVAVIEGTLLAGVLLFVRTRHEKRMRRAVRVFVPCIVLAAVCIGGAPWPHYPAALTPYAVFALLVVAAYVVRRVPRLSARALCGVAAVLAIAPNMGHIITRRWTSDDTPRTNYYRAAYVMSQIAHPKVLCDGMDVGIGLPAGTLPACKYWIIQAGATEEMRRGAEAALRAGVPDFVCVSVHDEGEAERMRHAGYVFYCHAPVYFTVKEDGGTAIAVYGRPGLRLPPDDFRVSRWDVWLKRNIFGI